jgi:hypothetical protein
MSKITFCSDNKVLNADFSILTGTADAQFPLSNIKHAFTTKVFRSTTASVSILIDLGVISEIDIICLKGSTIDGIGFNSCYVESSSTPVFSGSGAYVDISTKYNFAFKELSSNTNRYWKLTFTGETYVEISNIYIGKKIQLIDNHMSQGFSYSRTTNNSVSKNNYGQRFINSYNTIEVLSGDIKYVNSTEFDQLNAIHVQHGENSPIWFLLDPQGSMSISDSEFQFSGYFYMKDLQWKNTAPSLYDVSISLEEAT